MGKIFSFFAAFLLAVFFILPAPALAENEFSTSYDVNYDIGQDGVALVSQKISLKNLTDRYYASNFTLSIGSTTVAEASATNESGAMETYVENKGNKTVITVKFNQQVAGLDKVQSFTLKFKSKDFAQPIGKTWEVNLPKIPEASNIDKYNLALLVPLSFGNPTSISPLPKSQSASLGKLQFNFTKDQLEQSGVSINFGTSQLFDFNINYKLANTSLFPVTASLALPPDTPYQDVALNQLNPQPLNVTVDEDGNYLAWYRLAGNSKESVVATGTAQLYIKPKSKQSPPLTPGQIQELTKTDQYWEKDNPSITATLTEIFKKDNPSSDKEKIKLIYRYVVDTLKYDTERINNPDFDRLGAVTALNNPNSTVCMEFTDLFIALSRAAGIPARELDGYAYSQNKNLRPLSLSRDLLHAWPEYYDEKSGWVMVDPTWENTSGGVDYFNKFDLNHFVLAKKGFSSKEPFVSDDVKVTISQGEFISRPKAQVEGNMPETIWAGFTTTLPFRVLNLGNVVQPPQTLNIKSSGLENLGRVQVELGAIPPYGSVTYEVQLKAPFSWQSSEGLVDVEASGQTVSQKVTVKPFFLFYPFPYIFAGLLGIIISIYLLTLAVHLRQKTAKVPVPGK